jgi:hypothetical protein
MFFFMVARCKAQQIAYSRTAMRPSSAPLCVQHSVCLIHRSELQTLNFQAAACSLGKYIPTLFPPPPVRSRNVHIESRHSCMHSLACTINPAMPGAVARRHPRSAPSATIWAGRGCRPRLSPPLFASCGTSSSQAIFFSCAISLRYPHG